MLGLEIGSTGTVAAFEAAIRQSHKVRVRCEVWTRQGNFITTLYPVDGEIVVDANRSVRRSLSLKIIDEDGSLMPRKPTDTLAPFKINEIRVWRGITFSNGTYAEVAQGVFSITDVELVRSKTGITIDINGEDRAWNLSKEPLKSVKSCDDGANIATFLGQLASDVDPTITTAFASTTYTLGNLKFGTDDSLNSFDIMREIASGAGQEIYFDNKGILRTSNIPILESGSSVFTFNEGDDGVTMELRRALTSEKINNGVKLSAEGIGAYRRWQSVIYDEDPASPTNRASYGEYPVEIITRVPRYISTDIYGTASTVQSDWMARAMLQTFIGQPITLNAIPNPLLDVRDIVRVQSSLFGIDTFAMIDRISMPLKAWGMMEVEMRSKWL